jgi:D-tyrosyl-tRNA(Tyr) deacylase
MRAVVQRVSEGSVSIDGQVHARIGKGFVILLGIRKGDTEKAALGLAERCSNLRVFEDNSGKMNLSLKDVNGSVLVVSQFTLYADTRKGNRPGFSEAAPADEAEPLYNHFVQKTSEMVGSDRVATGVFRAMMSVTIVNDGPVTIVMEEG